MNNLKLYPSVFAVGNHYEISLTANENGLFAVKVGDSVFYADNAGVLPTEKSYAKIKVPQSILNSAEEYTALHFRSPGRKGYYSKIDEPSVSVFPFKPIKKTEGINIYFISDVHGLYGSALESSSYFGENLDLFIAGGDLTEYYNESDYMFTLSLLGEITKGEIPIVFAKGNHDSRGSAAEDYHKYFPCVDSAFFYTVEIGPLRGIILDLGEDKPDCQEEYGGVTFEGKRFNINDFHSYRVRQKNFLEGLCGEYDFAVSHTCVPRSTIKPYEVFHIEKELYGEYNRLLSKLKIKFMLSGHNHIAEILERHGKSSLIDNDYPAVMCTQKDDESVTGCALTYYPDRLCVRFKNTENTLYF